MTSDASFVLDTGVLVSALLLPRSVPRQAFDRVFADGVVLASVATIDELDDVLRRPKFDSYVGLTQLGCSASQSRSFCLRQHGTCQSSVCRFSARSATKRHTIEK